jgi:hypothetical protein
VVNEWDRVLAGERTEALDLPPLPLLLGFRITHRYRLFKCWGGEPSGPLQPYYVKSRLNLIDDQDQTGWQSRERAEVCDGLGGYCKTAFHFDPDAVRDAA